MRIGIFMALGVALTAIPFLTSAQTGTPCNQFGSGSTPPAGYGAAWNVLSSTKELLVYATCGENSTVWNVGTGAANQYIYKVRYIYSTSATSWAPTTLTGTFLSGSTDWLAGRGTATASGKIVSTPLYWVGYVCQWIAPVGGQAGAWKCGCRDAACATPHWQLQATADPFTSGTTGGTTGGSTGGTTGGTIPAPDRTIPVSNASQFIDAVNNARAGDHIVLANGTYPAVTVSRSGASGKPVVIRAANKLGAKVGGDITLDGNHVWIIGIDFTNGAGVNLNGDNNRISSSHFYTGSKAIPFGNDATGAIIDHNDFHSAATCDAGSVMPIYLSPNKSGYNPHIYRNYFHDAVAHCNGANGNSALHIGGLSNQSAHNVGALIEYNLFADWLGDDEIISIKSSSNVIRFNTVIGGKEFVNRHGQDNTWSANWFEGGAKGIRVHDGSNTVIGNHAPTIRLFAGDVTPAQYEQGVSRPEPYPSSFDTLVVGNNATLQIGYGDGVVPATNTRVEAHTGTISKMHEINTTISNTTSRAVPQAFKLTPSQVGPNAPTAPR